MSRLFPGLHLSPLISFVPSFRVLYFSRPTGITVVLSKLDNYSSLNFTVTYQIPFSVLWSLVKPPKFAQIALLSNTGCLYLWVSCTRCTHHCGLWKWRTKSRYTVTRSVSVLLAILFQLILISGVVPAGFKRITQFRYLTRSWSVRYTK